MSKPIVASVHVNSIDKAKKVMEFLKEMGGEFGHDSNRRVVKSIPMRPKWTTLYNSCAKIKAELKATQDRLDSARELMWATIATDANLHGADLHITDDNTHVEVYATDEKKKK